MMRRALYLVPGLLIFLSVPAFAATLDAVKGSVVINPAVMDFNRRQAA